MPDTINTTLATLRNITTTETSLQQGDAPNNSLTTSADWNFPYWSPYIPATEWTYPQYAIDNVSYTSVFISCGILLLVLIVAIVCFKLVLKRRRELLLRQAVVQRRAARQQAATAVISSSTSNSNNGGHMGAKERDPPPAYNDIIPPNFIIKQSDPSSQDHRQGESDAVSTLTISTDIPSNFSSCGNLNSMANSTASVANNRSAVIAPPAVSETRVDITSSVHSNEAIV